MLHRQPRLVSRSSSNPTQTKTMLRATAMALNRIGGGAVAASRSLLSFSPALSPASAVPSSTSVPSTTIASFASRAVAARASKTSKASASTETSSGSSASDKVSVCSYSILRRRRAEGESEAKASVPDILFLIFLPPFFPPRLSTSTSSTSSSLSLFLETDSHRTQAKAVDSVMKDINARFGKGSIMFLGGEPEKM